VVQLVSTPGSAVISARAELGTFTGVEIRTTLAHEDAAQAHTLATAPVSFN
jgi:hypothetical protein